MIKYFLILILLPRVCYGMEISYPRYHINGKIVYKHEKHQSSDHEFTTVSDFNSQITQESIEQKAQQDTAIIDTKMSNKTKVILAGFSCSGTIIVALISALATYYSSKC